MWGATVYFPDVLKTGRWQVELFAGSSESDFNSGFPLVSLGRLFTESRVSLDPQETPDQAFVYIGMENVRSHTGEITGDINKKGIDIKSRSKVFTAGNILFGKLRPALNKVTLCPCDIDRGICSGEFLVLKPNTNLVKPRVLREVLASKFVLEQIVRFVSGAALPRIAVADLASIEVPLPPLDVQALIEKKLFDLDAERARLTRALSEIPSLYENTLLEALQLR